MSRFGEKTPNLKDMSFSPQNNSDNKEMTLESIAEQAPAMLAEYFRSEGIEDYKILETNRTRKSFFGTIEIEKEKFFFKFSGSEKISQELQGYRMASIFPHEIVRDHHFTEKYGFYIQDFCKDVSEGNLLMTGLNSAMLSNDQSQQDVVLAKTERMMRGVSDIFLNTLSTEPYQSTGRNDEFFSARLTDGDRIENYYKKEGLFLVINGNNVDLRKILGDKYFVNGKQIDLSIEEQIEIAKQQLDPSQPRLFVLSQGDPTESNITVNGKFFDFEVAGINSLAQELAIFCCHSYLSGHYITPKYSRLSRPQDIEFANKFSELIEARGNLTENGNLTIDLKFPLPHLKKNLIDQYNSIIVKPLENRLSPEQQDQLIAQFRSAVLMRLIGVKNILKLEEKDSLLYLGLVSHFSEHKEYKSVSEYIEDRFVSI